MATRRTTARRSLDSVYTGLVLGLLLLLVACPPQDSAVGDQASPQPLPPSAHAQHVRDSPPHTAYLPLIIKHLPPVSIPMRGVRVGPGQVSNPDFVALLRTMKVNWIQLVFWPQITEDGQLIEYWDSTNEPDPPSIEQLLRDAPRTEQVISSEIQQWHALGFKVFLLTYHERYADHHAYSRGFKGDVDVLLREAKDIAVKWARIAQENRVEMYAPRKEFQFWVGVRKAQEWDQDIIPEVRHAYKGDLVLGVTSLYVWDRLGKGVYEQEPVLLDISGYDYLGLDFYGSDVETFGELKAFYARFLLKAEELKKRYHLKGVVFKELGIPHKGTESFWNDRTLSGDQVMTRIYDIFFQLGAGRMDGFFPWTWADGTYDLPANRHEYITPTKVISGYYSSPITPYPALESIAARVETVPPITFEVSRTLLQEDFSDGSRWNLDGDHARIHDGMLEISPEALVGLKDTDTSLEWRDYVFRGRFSVIDGEIGFYFRNSGHYIPGPSKSSYVALIRPIAMFELSKANILDTGEELGGTLRELIPLVEYNKWHTFAFYMKGNALLLFIDDEKVAEYWDESPLLKGSIALDARGHALFDDFVVEELQ